VEKARKILSWLLAILGQGLPFEDPRRQVFSRRIGAPLRPGQVRGATKRFELVSRDGDIVIYILRTK
jgi:hypothetical protein